MPKMKGDFNMGQHNFTPPTPPGIPQGPTMPPIMIPTPPQNNATDPMELLIDYNAKFASAGPTLFRDDVVQQTMSILIGKNKPNALLIGQAGVGKTKIVEDIAWRIAVKNPLIPLELQNCTIYELPLSNLVAGNGVVGEVEQATKGIIAFASDPDNHAILFIDEIHQLVGDSQTYSKIAQILKPALARGDIKVIGATTAQEANNLNTDPAFNRRFTRLIVDEFTQEQTVEILRNAIPGFFAHYKNRISVPDTLLPAIVSLADEYRSAGSHRPDNALTLLDRSLGNMIISNNILKQQAIQLNNTAILAAIQNNPMLTLTEKMVKETAVRIMTGNSTGLAFNETELTNKLSAIKGQDDILANVVKLLKRYSLNLFPRKTPMTMLFAGSTGVGKTEVCKLIAEQMTGTKPIILNMTEYHDPASINRIIGAPAGYVGYNEHTELPFDCLETNPYQIILLDEFEKADKSVQRLFMSAFDEGHIMTSKNKTVDFSRCIIIATTNAGHSEQTKTIGFHNERTQPTKEDNINTLSRWFDIELLNRFQTILTFHELTESTYREILESIYEREIARIRSKRTRYQFPDTIPDDDLNKLVRDTYISRLGARPAGKAIQEYIESQVI